MSFDVATLTAIAAVSQSTAVPACAAVAFSGEMQGQRCTSSVNRPSGLVPALSREDSTVGASPENESPDRLMAGSACLAVAVGGPDNTPTTGAEQ